jgi:SAM-dependent methyltransferase
MGLRDRLVDYHQRTVHSSRVRRVAAALEAHVGRADRVLDVGAGTGEIGALVGRAAGASEVRGVDILVRMDTRIPVDPYDGARLPFPDDRFDVALLSDVLHHCPEPQRLLTDALRVAPRVVIKEHFAFGPLSRAALLAMDLAGNFGPGVQVEGHYFTIPSWVALVAAAGGRMTRLTWPLRVHEFPARLITSPAWQFVATVERASSGPGSAVSRG